MKVLLHPAPEDIHLSAVLYALSDPLRLMIIAKLKAAEECSCGDFDLPIAKSTLSHHIRTLREAGVVNVRSCGTLRLISLRSADLEGRFPGLLASILHAYESSASKNSP
ncbi:helix-turn-helix domain-containing protein [Paenibacillus sp. PL2-23]|uniref:ArsR/SmtB family transcription factor n=1 Tax=Paenibacillus sp. PL2-23 TaxID=2100729 RepID=UPI0030F84D92